MLFQIAPHLSFLWHILVTVSLPFIISIILAYLLHPLVGFLMKCGLSRLISILLLYLLILGGIFFFFWWVTPIFIAQIKELLEQLPTMEEQLFAYLLWLDERLAYLPQGLHIGIENSVAKLEQSITYFVEDFLENLGTTISSLLIFLIVPFLIFYLLQDIEQISRVLYSFVPNKQRKLVIKLIRSIDRALGEYIRGQITVSLLVGLLALIGYSIIGLPYPLFLAICVGVLNIIPYFGPFIGAAPALLIAFMTKPALVIWVIMLNTAIQVMEGNLISPYIVGKRLAIHPLFIILVLLIGAEAGGMIGLILAVPLFVILKEIVSNTVLHIREYKQAAKIDRI